ncbi:sortase (surface protein transpeptidase) [Blastococcus colisei]|uniref:Sortase (Surface protein transpeptidase) n=1 Tax=Blastococcus colisei TaxID=1564162 RepID=A0A543PHR8_9ACTN|nr:class F sortase [Blastococcus colisei]TQN43620.1 sortase (surface protein transpeptidase) [Blastococcus colisei]
MLAVVLAVVAVVALGIAIAGQQRAPQPSASPSTPEQSPSTPSTTGPQAAPPAPTSPAVEPVEVPEPVALRIPALDVSSDLLDLGLRDDGTVEVPSLSAVDQAGWYRNSPAPGAVGPAVLLGHVDSAEHGPGIFFELGALTAGAEVEVPRRDGSVAVFAVDRVERYAKDEFPTLAVYGNTPAAQLRLITCGGEFDPVARSYEDNVVAYATLVATRPA